MRKVIVQKFGGTSVADTNKIKNVARTVIREKENGNDVVVVVSAMGHTTDYLVKMARENVCEYNVKEAITIADKIINISPDLFEYPEQKAELSKLLQNNSERE